MADEQWHAQQRGSWRADGSYELHIPYADTRELMMDILKHGRHCQVLAPASLRQAVAAEAQALAAHYSQPPV